MLFFFVLSVFIAACLLSVFRSPGLSFPGVA
jgi:hypothetical protein